MIGNEEDFTAALGFQVPGMDEHISKLDPANFRKMIAEVVTMYPNFKAVATTLRNAKTATLNDWGAILWTGGEFYEAPTVRIWKSSTVSAAAIASPAVWSTHSSPARHRRRRPVRRRARRSGDDHPGRYQHGDPQRSGGRHEG